MWSAGLGSNDMNAQELEAVVQLYNISIDEDTVVFTSSLLSVNCSFILLERASSLSWHNFPNLFLVLQLINVVNPVEQQTKDQIGVVQGVEQEIEHMLW